MKEKEKGCCARPCGWFLQLCFGFADVGQFVVGKHVNHLGIPMLETFCLGNMLITLLLVGYMMFPGTPCRLMDLFKLYPFIHIVLSVASTISMYLAFSSVGAGEALAVYASAAPLTNLVGSYIYHERMSGKDIVANTLCILGLLLIWRPGELLNRIFPFVDFSTPSYVVDRRGYSLAALALLFKMGALLVVPTAMESTTPWTLSLLKIPGRALFTIVVVIYGPYTLDPTFEQLGYAVAIGTLNFLAPFVVSTAMKLIPLYEQSLIYSLDMLWAFIAGYFIFGEVPHAFSIIGGSFIWIALIVLVSQVRRPISGSVEDQSVSIAAETHDYGAVKVTPD